MISFRIPSFSDERNNLLLFLLLNHFQLMRFAGRSTTLLLPYLIGEKVRSKRTKNRIKHFQPSENMYERIFLDRFPAVTGIKTKDIDDFDDIKLACRTISSRSQIDWPCLHEDIEDTFSLNRFGWLFTAIHTRPSTQLARRSLKWIINWIDTMGKRFEHPAWESYSVSERLANWPFILRAIERFQLLDEYTEKKIAGAMGTHLDYLLENLELKGKFTNNHILNNARGLYIGGLATAHTGAVEKAKTLFVEWTAKLFHKDGMLKAGSSHYQFLLCQRFEQVYLLSHFSGDTFFAEFMRKWTNIIRTARDLFHTNIGQGAWRMPLIGDISPDYSPQWFSPLSTDGWEAVKKCYAWGESFPSSNQSSYKGLRKMSDGHYRCDRDDATVFWHVPVEPVPAGSHSHFDAGSFILFLNGQEIFADSGRFSYDVAGSAGVYAKAHSCLLVDGLGPFCEDHLLNLIDTYPYQSSHAVVSADKDDGPILSLDVDGYRRLARPVRWNREFSFKQRKMIIRDDIQSTGEHRLETRFIIAEGLSAVITDEGVCIESKGGQLLMKVLNAHDKAVPSFSMEKAEISKEYGRSDEALAFVVKNVTQGNHKNVFELRW